MIAFTELHIEANKIPVNKKINNHNLSVRFSERSKSSINNAAGGKKYVAKGCIVLMRDTWGTGTDSVGGNYREE